jgi:hypothetical protein
LAHPSPNAAAAAVRRRPVITSLEQRSFSPPQDTVVFGTLEFPAAEAARMSNAAIVALLVASGTSRLSAERIVAVEREGAACRRARSHLQSRH